MRPSRHLDKPPSRYSLRSRSSSTLAPTAKPATHPTPAEIEADDLDFTCMGGK